MKEKNSQKLLHLFRMIGLAEGVSFLILLGIAMPLKYVFNIPEAVKFCGWVHGALFISFLYFAFEVMGTLKKSGSWFGKAFLAAIVPCGTFVLDKQLKKEETLIK